MAGDPRLLTMNIVVMTLLVMALVISVSSSILASRRLRRLMLSYDEALAAKTEETDALRGQIVALESLRDAQGRQIAALESLRESHESIIAMQEQRMGLLSRPEFAHADF